MLFVWLKELWLKEEIEGDLERELEIYLRFFTNVIKETWRLIVLSVEKILIILILKYLEQEITDYLYNQHVAIARIKSHDL